jgi:hypothetical protein
MSVSVRIVAHAYAKLFSKHIAIMKKKIYNQPESQVITLNTEYLMQGISVSPGAPTDSSNPPDVHVPGRRGDLIP